MRNLGALIAVLLMMGVIAGVKPGPAQADAKLVYERAPADLGAVRRTMRDSALFEAAVAQLNDALKLPGKLTIRVGAEEGPLYDADLREIWIPYDFQLEMEDLFDAAGAHPDDVESLALDVVEHALYHEIGHALIDLLDLPVTGREEDAVDALATVMVIDHFEDGAEVAISAADAFRLQGELEADEGAEPDFWGEHSLDEQRFVAILCLTYGSAPERYRAEMPPEITDAGERCEADWKRQSRTWRRLLEPHRK